MTLSIDFCGELFDVAMQFFLAHDGQFQLRLKHLRLEVAPGKYAAPAWLATLVTLFGAPAMMWILVRFAAPDLVEDAEPRDRITVIAAVLVVVLGAFGVGKYQQEFFTCGDFMISGNSQPPGCTPGDPSLDILRR